MGRKVSRGESGAECKPHERTKADRSSCADEVKAGHRRFEIGREYRGVLEAVNLRQQVRVQKRQTLQINFISSCSNNMISVQHARFAGFVFQLQPNAIILHVRASNLVSQVEWHFTYNLV